MKTSGLLAGFIIGAVIVIVYKAGRSHEAPLNADTTTGRSEFPVERSSATSEDARDPVDDTNGAAEPRSVALESVVARLYSPGSIDNAVGALTAVGQRAFQLELVSEWAAEDGDAALLYASQLDPSLRRHALQRVARVRERYDPIDALSAERLLQAQDAFEHRRGLLAEWAVLDLASLYDYLEQTVIT
jgi:hypothetical protein